MDRRNIGMLKQSPGSCKPARCLWKTPQGEVWTVKPPAGTLPFDHAEEWLVLVLRPDEEDLLRDRFRLIESLAGKGWATPESVEHNADKSLVVTYSLRDAMLLDTWVKIPRTRSESAQLAYSMVRSLANAHKEGLIHSRLSPSCVIVTPTGPAFVDLPLGATRPGHDLESDARWMISGGSDTIGSQAADAKGLAAGIVWMLTGHAPHSGASPVDDLLRLGVPDRLAALLQEAIDPKKAPPELDALGDALASWIESEQPAEQTGANRSGAHKSILIGTAAAALAIGGGLGMLLGQRPPSTAGADAPAELARYQAELEEKRQRLETMQRREEQREIALRGLDKAIISLRDRPSLHPSHLDIINLIETLTWPLDDGVGAERRSMLHDERVRYARTIIEREHAAANAGHIEVMLAEVALGAWELQRGNLPEARRVLDEVLLRLSAHLKPSDPILRGTEQLLRAARGEIEYESEDLTTEFEPWVARVLANPVKFINNTSDADFAATSIAHLSGTTYDPEQYRKDVAFTNRMTERWKRERSFNQAP